MDTSKESSFTLGDIRVSPSHNTLSANDQTRKLQPKVMAVLHYLASNHGRVISNEELIKHVWEGRIVTHGSVQKSINALRSALTELMGEQEVIAHYSKRGYQLKIEPVFTTSFATTRQLQGTSSSSTHRWQPTALINWQWPRPALWLLGVIVISCFLGFAALHLGTKASLFKDHKTDFRAIGAYTSDKGHERYAVPHPDNEHVAYIREIFNRQHEGETESEIMIRNSAGADWRVAASHGSWFKLAWSPAGQHLVGIEVRGSNGPLSNPDFYEKPNYLYSFHIFSLDLVSNRLIEKQLLSQWQGRISSVTWWDENTLEFVAKQGPDSVNARYRYSLLDQRLSMLDEIEGVTNPVASLVFNKLTAITSLRKNKVQIDFLDEHQASLGRYQLDIPTADISWIPDGSGLLVYGEDERKLFTLYRDGQQIPIQLTDVKDRIFSWPRYRPDGKAIYYTEQERSSNIWLTTMDGKKASLTNNDALNYAASFSPDGEKIVYASVRNNQIQLWLIEAGQERQLTSQPLAKKVGAIIWSADGKHLVFNSGSILYHYNFLTEETTVMLSDSGRLEPVAFNPDTHQLLFIKNSGEVRNLWRINTRNQQQKQLTFGSVGSTQEFGGDIFFQYVGESGLWSLRNKGDKLEQAVPKLDENIKLLKLDDRGVYFLKGGLCRQSGPHYFEFSTGNMTPILTRDKNIASTTSFHPSKGMLHTDCYLPEANIMMLK